MFRMVILGAPGSGKGTISNKIIRDYALKHLSIGDILRTNVMNKSVIGLEAKKYMKSGQLVPDNVMLKIVTREMERLQLTPWLLDGYPRTLSQAKMLSNHAKLDLVLSLEVPSQVIIDRVKDRWIHEPSGRIYNSLFNPPKNEGKDDVSGEPLTQRPDDSPDAVLRRLEIYAKNTEPLKKFYLEAGLLMEFKGTESNEIYPRVKMFLDEVIPKQHHTRKPDGT